MLCTRESLKVLATAFILLIAPETRGGETPLPGQNQAPLPQGSLWTSWHLPGVQFSITEGLESQYNFRGEDLTPGAGLSTSDLAMSAPGFGKSQSLTLEAWGGIQVGHADYAGVPWYIGGTQATGPALSHEVRSKRKDIYFKEGVWTDQSSFRELDLSARYKMDLGSMLVAELGDIKYFSDYSATSALTLEGPPTFHYVATGTRHTTNDYASHIDSQNRNDIYFNMSTNPAWFEYLVPDLTYYETFNQQPRYYQTFVVKRAFPRRYVGKYMQVEAPRYGGYLEGRLDGYVPLIRRNAEDVFCLRPYTLLSISFDDETEATSNYGRKYFTGWNNFELGVDAPWELNKYLTITGFLAYSRELSEPDQNTNRNEVWGGARVTVRF